MRIFVILMLFLVVGCSTKPASVSVAQVAKESISAAYNALPKECQTDAVKEMLVSAQAQIETVTVACDTEKEVLQNKIAQLESWLMTIVVIIVGVFFLSRRQ